MDEVHRRNQRLKLRKAIKAGWFEEFEIADMARIELYAQYRVQRRGTEVSKFNDDLSL